MTKLIQLKLSKDKLEKYNKLVNMLGIKGTFGEYQKAIDFSIDLAILSIENEVKVTLDLDNEKLDLFLSSIKELKKQRIKAELIQKIEQSS